MRAIVKSLDKLDNTTYTLRNLANEAWEFADVALCEWEALSNKEYYQGFVSEDEAIASWEVTLESAHRAAIEADRSLELLSDRLHKVNACYVEVLNSLSA